MLFRMKGAANIERGEDVVLRGIVAEPASTGCMTEAVEGRSTAEGRQGGKDRRSVIMPRVGWFSGDFSIVDLSQCHPNPCLPALFIYPRLFLSDFEPSAVWLGRRVKMGA